MDDLTLTQIVDMATIAAKGKEFSQDYEFPNGMKVTVTRNFMIPGGKHGYMGVLPFDKDGRQLDSRAENWMTTTDVARKMQLLASE